MKQMRSRFRLITFLLVCAFFLALAVCARGVMNAAGIGLPSVSDMVSGVVPSLPGSGDAVGEPASEEFTPAPSVSPSEVPPEAEGDSGTDNTPVPEYNVYGL